MLQHNRSSFTLLLTFSRSIQSQVPPVNRIRIRCKVIRCWGIVWKKVEINFVNKNASYRILEARFCCWAKSPLHLDCKSDSGIPAEWQATVGRWIWPELRREVSQAALRNKPEAENINHHTIKMLEKLIVKLKIFYHIAEKKVRKQPKKIQNHKSFKNSYFIAW